MFSRNFRQDVCLIKVQVLPRENNWGKRFVFEFNLKHITTGLKIAQDKGASGTIRASHVHRLDEKKVKMCSFLGSNCRKKTFSYNCCH